VAAHGDDHGLCGDAPSAVELEGGGIHEPGFAFEDELDSRCGETTGFVFEGANLVDGGTHARDRRTPLHLRRTDHDAVLVGDPHLAHEPRSFRQHAGRDAAGVDTGSPGAGCLDHRHPGSELRRPEGRGRASRAGPDHDEIIVLYEVRGIGHTVHASCSC